MKMQVPSETVNQKKSKLKKERSRKTWLYWKPIELSVIYAAVSRRITARYVPRTYAAHTSGTTAIVRVKCLSEANNR